MNPSGGIVKPINKIIGEYEQTEYFTKEQEAIMKEITAKLYQSMGVPSIALTSTSSIFTNENLRQLTETMRAIEINYPPKAIMYSDVNKSKIEESYGIKLRTKDEYHLNVRFVQTEIIDKDKIYVMDDIMPKYVMSDFKTEDWNEIIMKLRRIQMNLLSKLIYKLSYKRKQCKCCGKTFYKTKNKMIRNHFDYNSGYYVYREIKVSLCCGKDWIEV